MHYAAYFFLSFDTPLMGSEPKWIMVPNIGTPKMGPGGLPLGLMTTNSQKNTKRAPEISNSHIAPLPT